MLYVCLTHNTQIAEAIEADWVCYLSLDSLREAVRECADEAGVKPMEAFDCSCFDGKYVTGDVNDEYFAKLHLLRNDFTLKKINSSFKKDVDDLDHIAMYNSS